MSVIFDDFLLFILSNLDDSIVGKDELNHILSAFLGDAFKMVGGIFDLKLLFDHSGELGVVRRDQFNIVGAGWWLFRPHLLPLLLLVAHISFVVGGKLEGETCKIGIIVGIKGFLSVFGSGEGNDDSSIFDEHVEGSDIVEQVLVDVLRRVVGKWCFYHPD